MLLLIVGPKLLQRWCNVCPLVHMKCLITKKCLMLRRCMPAVGGEMPEVCLASQVNDGGADTVYLATCMESSWLLSVVMLCWIIRTAICRHMTMLHYSAMAVATLRGLLSACPENGIKSCLCCVMFVLQIWAFCVYLTTFVSVIVHSPHHVIPELNLWMADYQLAKLYIFTCCMECSRGIAMGIMSVCLSVCLSVRQTRGLWQNRRKLCLDFYIIWKNIYPSFLGRRMVGGGRPLLPEILGQPVRVGAKSPILNR